MIALYATAPVESSAQLVEVSTGRTWTVPQEGLLEFDFVCGPCEPSIDEVAPDAGVQGLKKMVVDARTDTEKEKLFNIATAGTDMYVRVGCGRGGARRWATTPTPDRNAPLPFPSPPPPPPPGAAQPPPPLSLTPGTSHGVRLRTYSTRAIGSWTGT